MAERTRLNQKTIASMIENLSTKVISLGAPIYYGKAKPLSSNAEGKNTAVMVVFKAIVLVRFVLISCLIRSL